MTLLARSIMAKRKMKRKSRRKAPVRLLNVAQGLVVANALTGAVFQTNAYEFITGRIGGAFRPGGDGQSRVTLPEILGFADSPFGLGKTATNSIGDVVRTNLQRPGAMSSAVLTLVLAPVAFKFGKRALGPVLRPINRQLKGSGVAL